MQVSVKQKRKTRAASALALAALTAVAIFSRSALADTPASWLSETSGNWTTGALWSTNPSYPNNGTPAATNYDAFISATGGTAYTVTLNSNITVNSLTLSSADATLNQTGGTLQAGSINLDAGSYQLNGGTLASATVDENGGSFTVENNSTLNGVSVTGGDLETSGNLYVENGLTIANHNLDLSSYGRVFFDGPSQSINNLSFSAAGNLYYIQPDGPNSGGSTTLTLGSGVIVHGGAQIGNYYDDDTVINNGIINADTNQITISTTGLTNNGTLEASGGQTLYLQPTNWSNAGTITAVGGSYVHLGSTFTTAELGTITADSTSQIEITGTLNNANTTFTPSAGGSWNLQGGTISGGTINVSNGNFLVQNNSTLNGVSVTGGDLETSGNLYVENGLTIANHNLDLSSYGRVFFDGPSQSINNLSFSAAGNLYYIQPDGPNSGGSTTLTLGSGVIVHGGAQIGNYYDDDTVINNGIINADTNQITISTTGLTNNGTLEASGGQTLYLQPTNWSNAGTITAVGGSYVHLGSTFTTAELGTITADSTSQIEITGTLNNANTTFTPSAGGSWNLQGGTISGGTINVSNGNFLVQNNSTLNGVSVTGGDLETSGNLYVENGLTIANHNLDLSSYGRVFFDGPSQSINNLSFSAAGNLYYIQPDGPNSGGSTTLTLGSGVIVHGGAQIGNYYDDDTVINNGIINADTNQITISTTGLTNNGTLEASGGQTLYLQPTNWSNAGTITAVGGSYVHLGSTFTTAELGTITADSTSQIEITGTLNNANTTFTPSAGGSWNLQGGTISGGTINVSNGNFLVQNNSTLNGVSVTGGDLETSGNLYVENGLTIANHNLDLSSYGRVFFDGPSQSINNLSFSAAGNLYYIQPDGPNSGGSTTLTLGSGVIVHGGAQIGNYYDDDTVINNGIINADTNQITISTTGLTNNGTLEASGGDTLYLQPTNLVNNGTIESLAGSTLTISSANFLDNGTLITQGAIQTTGGLTVLNNTVTLTSGLLQTGSSGSLAVSGTSAINQSGTSTANVEGPLVLAPLAGDQASYNLSSGTVTCQQYAAIGANGIGVFTQTGGTTTVDGIFAVGNSGTLGAGTGVGSANISGGIFICGTALLGSTVGGSGEVTISGTANFTIGGGAHLNDMTVNGGTVTVLDQTPPAGEDTELNYALVGGYLTNGALNVNGGSVTSPFLKLGITKNYTGTFDQTGGSATFTILSAGCDGTLTSGQGNGIVNISGGTVSIDTLLLGSTQGGTADMTVSNGGSVSIAGGAHLNDLNVDPGGSVTVSSTPLPSNTPHDDEDPELQEALVAGYLTNGALNVNGGSVTAPFGKFGITAGMTGTYSQGSGTTSIGTLCIGCDGTLTSGAGVGVATISGGTLYAGSLLLGSTAGGSGAMTISGPANVTVAGGAHVNDLTIEAGTFTVLDGTPPAGEDPELADAVVGGYLTSGAFNVGSTAFVSVPYIKLGLTNGKTGTFNQTGGIVNAGTLCVGDDITTSSGSGMGQALISGGSLVIGKLLVGSNAGGVGTVSISGNANVDVTSAITLDAGSNFQMSAGSLTADNATISLPSSNITIGDGTSSAELHLHNSSVAGGGGASLTIAAHALLDGGSDGETQNVGSALFSNTSLTLGASTSVLHMTLGGDPTNAANAGNTFDQISMAGGVFTVGGATLEILPLSGVVIGEPYPIVVASGGGSINYSNAFSNLETDPAYSSVPLTYSVSYSSSAIDLTVFAPEPGSAALLAASGMMLVRRRRRGR